MSILYNCHSDNFGFRITKFNDGEVESSYICTESTCECPAGVRTSCRHRQMLPMFIARGAVDSWWFLDFERKGWVSNEPLEAIETRISTKPVLGLSEERSEPYGIGPTIIEDLPIIKADNERARQRNVENEPYDKVYLPPSLYDAAERQGCNMTAFEKQELIPTCSEPYDTSSPPYNTMLTEDALDAIALSRVRPLPEKYIIEGNPTKPSWRRL